MAPIEDIKSAVWKELFLCPTQKNMESVDWNWTRGYIGGSSNTPVIFIFASDWNVESENQILLTLLTSFQPVLKNLRVTQPAPVNRSFLDITDLK